MAWYQHTIALVRLCLGFDFDFDFFFFPFNINNYFQDGKTQCSTYSSRRALHSENVKTCTSPLYCYGGDQGPRPWSAG